MDLAPHVRHEVGGQRGPPVPPGHGVEQTLGRGSGSRSAPAAPSRDTVTEKSPSATSVPSSPYTRQPLPGHGALAGGQGVLARVPTVTLTTTSPLG